VMIDAVGDRAFAAGGDIVDLYAVSRGGDLDYGRRFWAEEYRLNARISEYPKPYVALMHGFTMGGGVGVSCHGSHRIVDDSVQIAMPECGIGLIPDVGGTWLLSRSSVGAYVGLTGHRMGPEDAIFTGFADSYIPRLMWPELIRTLCETGDVAAIKAATHTPPSGTLIQQADDLAEWFAGDDVVEILRRLDACDAAAAPAKALRRSSPLAAACALTLIRMAQGLTLRQALTAEYRFVSRSVEHGDLLEGIRAQVIDKDRTPQWRHVSATEVTPADIASMLAPLGPDELTFD
ncbi:MAG: enoyl-CoA hydratase/isomerase family protein, partial [Primorskyibacter sp.]